MNLETSAAVKLPVSGVIVVVVTAPLVTGVMSRYVPSVHCNVWLAVLEIACDALIVPKSAGITNNPANFC